MIESIKAVWSRTKRVVTSQIRKFSQDPASLLTTESTVPFKDRYFFSERGPRVADRLWLHKNQDKAWARQMLAYQQNNTLGLAAYIERLAHTNKKLGEPVKIRAEDIQSLTVLDLISVEKALLDYQVALLLSDDGHSTKSMNASDRESIIQTLKATGATPNWMIDNGNSKTFQLFKRVRDIDCTEWFIFGVTSAVIGLFLINPVLSDIYTPVYATLALVGGFTLFYGSAALLAARAYGVKRSVFNMSWVRKISKTWKSVLNIDTPQDAVLLGAMSETISAYDVSTLNSNPVRLPNWSPLDVLAYAQAYPNVPTSLIAGDIPLKPLQNIEVPDILVHRTTSVSHVLEQEAVGNAVHPLNAN